MNDSVVKGGRQLLENDVIYTDDDTVTITLLVTSDIHGHIYATTYRDDDDTLLGVVKLASIINQERERSENVLLIDNGDLIQGSPLTYYYAKHCKDEIHPCITVLNVLQYDVAVIGNHEFNYGYELLEKAVKDSSFPWLSANILAKNTGEPAFGKPYLIRNFHGIKIAILGLTTKYIPNWERQEHIAPYDFMDAVEAAKTWVTQIRQHEQPDLLVVSYHGGFEKDLTTGRLQEPDTGENQGYALCQEIEGIDILITGHQHRQIASKRNGVTVLQPGCNAKVLGKIDISFVRQNEHWILKSTHPSIVHLSAHTPVNNRVYASVLPMENKTQKWLDQPIGYVDGNLLIDDHFQARLKEHPFIQFLHEVQMEASGASISVASLFDNTCHGLPKRITMRDVISNYMFPNTLTVLLITGQDIKDALEKTATYFTVENGILRVNPSYLEPKLQHYNYDMWEGIEYELDISKPEGKRVTKLMIQNKPLDMNAEYEVVMNNYRASGGGNYNMFVNKPVVKEILTDMTELIANYILKRGTIHSSCNHNWKVIQSNLHTIEKFT